MPNLPFPKDFPFSVEDLRAEFDRLLDRVWHGGLRTAPLDGQDWAPCIDVADEGDCYTVRVEVPGLSADDVKVSMLDGTLTVCGNKPHAGKLANVGENVRRLRTECRYGNFCRKYEFPAEVDENAVRAACKHGVLDITIPKATGAQGKSVTIESQD